MIGLKTDKNSVRLYAITDRTWLEAGETLPQATEKAIRGGATFIQLREKHTPYDELKALALEVKAVCRDYNVPFVINDNVALAKEIDADGVHIGQSDMELKAARELLGSDKIIGVTAPRLELALTAERLGASYVGAGAVFPTGTKGDAKPLAREELRKITEALTIPVVAIGGITADNVETLGGLGLSGAAVVSAIFAQRDIYAAAKQLRERCDRVFG